MTSSFRVTGMILSLSFVSSWCAAGALRLTNAGYGKIKFGISLADAEKQLGQKAKVDDDSEAPRCLMVDFAAYPGLHFMVLDGKVVRAEAYDPSVATADGLKVGSTVADVKSKHPGVAIEPHRYTDGGHYLTLWSADRKRAVQMEEEGGKVTELRSGLTPAVSFIEGCH